MHEMITPEMGDVSFGDYADLAKEGKTLYGSYWEHLKSGWARRGHPNIKFIWFEDLKSDTAGNIRDHPFVTSTNLTDFYPLVNVTLTQIPRIIVQFLVKPLSPPSHCGRHM